MQSTKQLKIPIENKLKALGSIRETLFVSLGDVNAVRGEKHIVIISAFIMNARKPNKSSDLFLV